MEYFCENVLGINFTTLKKKNILEKIEKYIKKDQISSRKLQKKLIRPLIIFTPNPEIVMFAQKNPFFRKIVNSAQINIPDGAGIVWALKKIHNHKVKRISGVDLMVDLCEMAAKKRVIIGLIGGRDKVALKTAECLRVKIPGVKIIVFPAPEIKLVEELINDNKKINIDKRENKKILNTKYLIINPRGKQNKETEKYFGSLLKEIRSRKIQILFVAFGFPKQEYFIKIIKDIDDRQSKNIAKKPLILMSVGGAFDYISGRIPRAPQWMRDGGMEWLYRLMLEPWRLLRQIKGSEFFLRVLLQH
jgi:N-acetylglucosaminyldiphosphoundecaprenol N-acetyl-beta-D-mannosaminyltransferase